MPALSTLLLALVSALPTTDVETLSGNQHKGQLEKVSQSTVVLNSNGKTVTIPTKEVLSLGLNTSTEKQPVKQPYQVVLRDGTSILCTNVSSLKKQLKLKSALLGEITVPLEAVLSIRLASAAGKIEQSWNELTSRKLRKDYLVVQKGDVLDHLDGAIGALDSESVQFLIDDSTIPVKREKVFGLIYARTELETSDPLCSITLNNGDSLRTHSINLVNNSFEATLYTGSKFNIPVEYTTLLDFSLGKVMYLSQTKPRDSKFTSFFRL